MKNQKGITMVALVITVVILIILTFTVTINTEGYKLQNQKAKFRSDLSNLTEEISQYYARKKELPYLKLQNGNPVKFDKNVLIAEIDSDINVNDNDVYCVIDLSKLGIRTNYGSDTSKLLQSDMIENETVSDLSLDIFVINEQSHTIYYPRGVEYNEKINYTISTDYSEIENREVEF